jgi:ribonuclease R
MSSTEIINNRKIIKGLTIDGSFSRDLDDAFWLEVIADGYLLHISIADVAAEIEPASDVDQAAYKQAFTRYLKHSNRPMLPAEYSENALSLLEGKERKTITISIPIDAKGVVGKIGISKTYLKSEAKLSYQQADEMMATPEHQWHNMLRQCYTLAKMLFANRRQQGAIALYSLKQGLATSEEGIIKSLSSDETYNSHILTQEFMILVNTSLAYFFAEHQIPCLYRNHTAKATAPERSQLLEDVNNVINMQDNSRINTLVNTFALIFNKAEYAPVIAGHYALNLPAYLHMTSPIRRYADLVNLRQLSAFVEDQALPYCSESLTRIGEHINAVILVYKQSQNDFFRKVRHQQQQELLIKDDLSALDTHDFYHILQAAIYNKQLPPNFQEELNTRLLNEALTLQEMLLVLLQTDDSTLWLNIKRQLLKWLADNLHRATGIVMMAAQKLQWQPHYQTEQLSISPPRFFTVATVKRKNDTFSSASSVDFEMSVRSKKISQHLANFSLLANRVNLDLDIQAVYRRQNHVENPATTLKDDPQTLPLVNYISQLMELCQQKGWCYPEYNIHQQGTAQHPLFSTKATILIEEKQYCSANMQGSNKKLLKQQVSAMLLEQIHHLPAKKASATNNNPNFIGKLNNLLQQHKQEAPRYRFNDVQGHGLGQFQCICTVTELDQNLKETIAYGNSKKDAKQQAAAMMWDKVRNRPEITSSL